jgi:hypothetical protein
MHKIGLLASLLAPLLLGAISPSPAHAAVLITIDKLAQAMTVTVDGVPRYHWPVSTGRFGYATPVGTFHPSRMEPTYFSKEWDDAPMPHAIFFTAQGHAIHGSLDTAQLGWAVSHGCVRISPENATTLYSLVSSEGMNHTTVVITGLNFGFAKLNLPKLSSDKPLFPKHVGSRVSDWLDQTFGRTN